MSALVDGTAGARRFGQPSARLTVAIRFASSRLASELRDELEAAVLELLADLPDDELEAVTVVSGFLDGASSVFPDVWKDAVGTRQDAERDGLGRPTRRQRRRSAARCDRAQHQREEPDA